MNRHQKSFISRIDRTANSDGLTLIECLVAIAVIGLTATVMAPVMVFSLATRIQSQRAEQALQVAQGEVDKIRLMVERGGDFSSQLYAYPSTTSVAATTGPNSIAADWNSTTTNVAKQVNIGDGSQNKFAVQVFRSVGSTPSGSTVPITFDIGVRVYDSKAFQNNSSNLLTDPAGLGFTGGEGQRSSRPLAVIYTSIFQGDREGALCTYRQHLSTASTITNGLNCN